MAEKFGMPLKPKNSFFMFLKHFAAEMKTNAGTYGFLDIAAQKWRQMPEEEQEVQILQD